MLYRVRVDLCFEAEDKPQAIFDKAESFLASTVKLIGERAVEVGESSFIEIHRCYHDEDPPKPCEVIKRIEVEGSGR